MNAHLRAGWRAAITAKSVITRTAEDDEEHAHLPIEERMRAKVAPHIGVRTASGPDLTFEHHDMNERPDSEGRTYHRLMAINTDDKAVGMIDYKRGETTVHPFSVNAHEPHVADALHAEMTCRHPNHQVVTPGAEKSAQEPEPTAWYHGTTVPRVRQILPASQHGRHVTFPHDTDRDHAYATSSHEDAWAYAEKAWHAGDGHSGRPRVYQVQPKGDYEKDPVYDGDRRRGNNETDYRSKHGWDVVKEMNMPRSMGKPSDWR